MIDYEPSVSVIVPTYDAPVLLRAVLASLGAQLYPRERAEIIVVSNKMIDQAKAVGVFGVDPTACHKKGPRSAWSDPPNDKR